jgi:hypothetical protein
MHKTILLPTYPEEASGRLEHLPHSIQIEAEEGGGLLRAVMHYAVRHPDTERHAARLRDWVCEHDENGCIRTIEFPQHRARAIYVSLYNAVLAIGVYAERATVPAPYHFGLAQSARWLLHYLDANEERLRTGLAIPFTSPML